MDEEGHQQQEGNKSLDRKKTTLFPCNLVTRCSRNFLNPINPFKQGLLKKSLRFFRAPKESIHAKPVGAKGFEPAT